MNHQCPKCGHEWQAPAANQQAGGKARWKGKTAAQRKEAAKAAALARWANQPKAAASHANGAKGGRPVTKKEKL